VFDPAGCCKSQGAPLAYNRLSVLKLPTLAVSVTYKLPETLAVTVVIKLFDVMLLPVMFAPTVKKLVTSLLLL
jgi:hypothetical protein